MEKPDYLPTVYKQATMQPAALFPRFQRHLFFDKAPEAVGDMLEGTYGKEYTFYQLWFPYPLVAFAGCGNRHHPGHCCSEIAFTEQSRRTGCIQTGNRGPHAAELHTGMDNVHYLWLGHKEPRKDFIEIFGRSCFQTLFSSLLPARPLYLLASFSLEHFHYVWIILHFTSRSLMADRMVATTLSLLPWCCLSLSHIFPHFFLDILTFYWHTSPCIQPPSMYAVTLLHLCHWIGENHGMASWKILLMFLLKWRDDMKRLFDINTHLYSTGPETSSKTLLLKFT